jgi:hypothetical protein
MQNLTASTVRTVALKIDTAMNQMRKDDRTRSKKSLLWSRHSYRNLEEVCVFKEVLEQTTLRHSGFGERHMEISSASTMV